ncbi:hypothetical protein D3C73_836120 [compost metagenome]
MAAETHGIGGLKIKAADRHRCRVDPSTVDNRPIGSRREQAAGAEARRGGVAANKSQIGSVVGRIHPSNKGRQGGIDKDVGQISGCRPGDLIVEPRIEVTRAQHQAAGGVVVEAQGPGFSGFRGQIGIAARQIDGKHTCSIRSWNERGAGAGGVVQLGEARGAEGCAPRPPQRQIRHGRPDRADLGVRRAPKVFVVLDASGDRHFKRPNARPCVVGSDQGNARLAEDGGDQTVVTRRETCDGLEGRQERRRLGLEALASQLGAHGDIKRAAGQGQRRSAQQQIDGTGRAAVQIAGIARADEIQDARGVRGARAERIEEAVDRGRIVGFRIVRRVPKRFLKELGVDLSSDGRFAAFFGMRQVPIE